MSRGRDVATCVIGEELLHLSQACASGAEGQRRVPGFVGPSDDVLAGIDEDSQTGLIAYLYRIALNTIAATKRIMAATQRLPERTQRATMVLGSPVLEKMQINMAMLPVERADTPKHTPMTRIKELVRQQVHTVQQRRVNMKNTQQRTLGA